MFSIRPLPEFTAWLDGLKDETVRGVIVARIKRLERGLMGRRSAGGRERFGVAYPCGRGMASVLHPTRDAAYCAARRRLETTQKKDIKRAKALAALLD